MTEAVPWRRHPNARSIWPGFTGRVGWRRFGDDWEHGILIEDVTAPKARTAYPDASPAAEPARPRMAATSGHTTIDILADSRHEEHKESSTAP
jgi:hypothetical protein